MRTTRVLAAAVILCGTITIANAQPGRRPGGAGGPGGGGGFGGGMPPTVERLKVKAVAEDLKISQEQLEKLKTWSEGAPQRIQAAVAAAVSAEVYRQLGDVLTPEQIKRLKQIELQASGIRVFTNPEVSAALKLSEEQKSEIQKIGEEASRASREAFSGLFGGRERPSEEKMAEARKKSAEILSEGVSKAKSVLSEDQKKSLNDLLGEPFDISVLPRGGFGGGGGAGGRFGGNRPQPRD